MSFQNIWDINLSQDSQWLLRHVFRPSSSFRYYFHTLTLTCKCSRKTEVCTAASFDLSKARLSRADFEVVGYLWLGVLEVDINVGYRKHLTVRISIRRQLGAQPIERVKRVTLRRASSRCISRGVHYRRRGYNDAFGALDEALRKCTQTSTKTCANTNDTLPMVFVYLFLNRIIIWGQGVITERVKGKYYSLRYISTINSEE